MGLGSDVLLHRSHFSLHIADGGGFVSFSNWLQALGGCIYLALLGYTQVVSGLVS